MTKKTGLVKDDVNQHILNIITPAGVDYDTTHANIGDGVGKIFTVSKFPSKGVDYGWLAPLCNIEGTATTIEFRNTDSSNMIKVFNDRIDELKGDKDLAREESEKQRIDKAIKDVQQMIHRLAINNEPVGYVNIMLHVQDSNEKMLLNRIKRVSGQAAIVGCNIRILKYKQFQAMKCMSPYGVPDRVVSNVGARNMPVSSFFGGFPMANSGINDPGGFYIAKTKTGRLIILNQWMRNKDRVNSNWFITGLPGVGKSTALKTIFVKELAFGTKFIIFDPEEEYVELARNEDIKGDIIDCAGGSTGRINPLQIRVAPRIKKEDLEAGETTEDFIVYDDEQGASDMALHIQNLRVFFKLYFGAENFTSEIKAALEETLIFLYQKFGIGWDTDISAMNNEDFPIMEDLYRLVKEKAVDKKLSEYKKNIYDRLADLLYPIGEGADQFIWNGHTTINARSQFVVLNTSRLQDLDENVKRAQYMNMTMWGWQQMAKDRTEKVLLGVDEGYLVVDPEYPDLMKFFRNVSKRARKYEAGLMFITHSVVDVLDPAVKRLGQAIIDNSCYKFIMGCDGKNLEETKKLFHLTEVETDMLAAKNRGEGILFAGGVRVNARIEVRERFLQMFGKAGGR